MPVFAAIRNPARVFLRSGCLAMALGCGAPNAHAATFTYQGVLKSAGSPLNGAVDLKFRLYANAAGAGIPLGNLAINGVVVTDGLLKVDLDFGPNAFNGTDRWMVIEVLSPANGGIGSFTTLSPLQQITYAPMAQHALNATLTGSYANAVTFSNVGNAFTGSGAGLTSLNPASISSGTVGNALTLNNAGNVFSGNGNGLTSINASSISSGNLNVARLPLNGLWAIDNPLRIDNSTFAIDPAGGRVGIGTILPQYTLHVVGDMSFNGPIIMTTVPTIPTTTRYVTISACEFVPRTHEPDYVTTVDRAYRTTPGSIAEFTARINLPGGATMTDISVSVYDNSAAQFMNAGYYFRNWNSTVATGPQGSANSSGAVNDVQILNVPVGAINTQGNTVAFLINVNWTVPATPTQCQIIGARVTYTIDQPLP